LKLSCSIFILSWVCYFLPNFTTFCSAEVKAALTGTTGRKSTIIPATNTQLAWQHMRSCHVTGPACISTLNLRTTHTVCIYFGLSCASCECSQKTACYCTCPATSKCPSYRWGVQWLSLSLL